MAIFESQSPHCLVLPSGHHNMRWLFIIFSVLFLFWLSEHVAYGNNLTLPEATTWALRNSPTLKQSLARETIAGLDLSTSQAAFLPSLGIDSTHGLEKNHRPTLTEPWVSNFQIKLSENLYDNGESLTRYRQSKVVREMANLKYQRDRDRLVLDVATQFYSFSQATRRSRSKDEQLRILKKQFDSVSFQYQQGLKLRKDFLRMKTERQRTEIETRAAHNTEERARWELKKLLGVSPGDTEIDFTPLLPESLVLPLPGSPPSVQNTWDVRIATLENRLKPLDTYLASRRYWPTLKLTGSAYYGANNYLGGGYQFSDTDNYGANVLLTLSYNIWDWGTLRREVEKAKTEEMISENELHQVELAVGVETKAVMLNLSDLKANDNLSAELLKTQQDAFTILERDYRDGQSTYYDYIQGLNDLISARILVSDSRFNLASALAKYRYLEGKLYESIHE